jgi:hypothetical protein
MKPSSSTPGGKARAARPKERLMTVVERMERGVERTKPKDSRLWVERFKDIERREEAMTNPSSSEANSEEVMERNADKVNKALQEYLGGYELRADEGDHTPTDFERLLIEDAIQGLMVEDEFVDAFVALHAPFARSATAATPEPEPEPNATPIRQAWLAIQGYHASHGLPAYCCSYTAFSEFVGRLLKGDMHTATFARSEKQAGGTAKVPESYKEFAQRAAKNIINSADAQCFRWLLKHHSGSGKAMGGVGMRCWIGGVEFQGDDVATAILEAIDREKPTPSPDGNNGSAT